MVYKITLEYLGTGFYGLERQQNLTTVAGTFESELNKICAAPQKVVYASRTDKDVSALCQVASFECDEVFEVANLKYKLNRMLNPRIRVKKVEIASGDFRANKNVESKTYRYSLFVGETLYPLETPFCAHCFEKLNISKIKKAAKMFVGTHDFSAFCSADCEKDNKVRTIYKLQVKQTKIKNINGTRLDFFITGNGFLQHMVRIIVGTLVKIGKGELAPTDIPQLFKLTTREKTNLTLPATGLMLIDIKYKKPAN